MNYHEVASLCPARARSPGSTHKAGSLAGIPSRPGKLGVLPDWARPPGGSNRSTGTPAQQPTRTFPSALSSGRSPFPTADMATVLPGKATPGGLSPARTSASIAARYVEYPPSSLVAAGTPRDATARSKFQSVVVLTRNLRYRKAGLLTDALIAGHRPVRAETCSRRVASAHSQFSRQVGSRVSGAGRGSKGTREMGALKG